MAARSKAQRSASAKKGWQTRKKGGAKGSRPSKADILWGTKKNGTRNPVKKAKNRVKLANSRRAVNNPVRTVNPRYTKTERQSLEYHKSQAAFYHAAANVHKAVMPADKLQKDAFGRTSIDNLEVDHLSKMERIHDSAAQRAYTAKYKGGVLHSVAPGKGAYKVKDPKTKNRHMVATTRK